MTNSINIQGYLDTIAAPWGQLFYQIIWKQLQFTGKQVLDFGSGFGVTANHLARKNTVLAIELNQDVLEHRIQESPYEQIHGSRDKLKTLSDASFDVIICHNVFEYITETERKEIIKEFNRLLKPQGILSVVKHNNYGHIMQKVVFENNIKTALDLLNNQQLHSANFGAINQYTHEELLNLTKKSFTIQNHFGVRTFFGLQQNEWKTKPNWSENMLQIETAVAEIPEYRNIAFYHHYLLQKHDTMEKSSKHLSIK